MSIYQFLNDSLIIPVLPTLAVVLDPERQRQQATRSVQQLTRDIDEKATGLVMTLADFGAQLRDDQRLEIKRLLAHG